jgi:hypothetical protein
MGEKKGEFANHGFHHGNRAFYSPHKLIFTL